MVTPILPRAQSPIADRNQWTTREWYDFFRSLLELAAEGTDQAAIIQQILARLQALEDEVGIEAVIQGLASINVAGTLAGGIVQITLQGDNSDPGNTYYYGTGPDGVKGFFAIADALIEGGGITLTVNSDGTIDIAHADTSSVADISASFTGGTVPDQIVLTFDQFGHVLTRTITGRTLDHNDTGALQGGSATERYHLTAAEHTGLLPWASEDPDDYALITQTITNGDATHAPSGDAVFDSLAGKIGPPGANGLDLGSERVFGTGLHNNAGSVSGTAREYIASGTYTPTISGTVNLSGTTAKACHWMRVGNVVHVAGQFDAQATAVSTVTFLEMSLPIASNFTDASNCAGTVGVNGGTAAGSEGFRILADPSDDTAQVRWISRETVNRAHTFVFTYLVL